MTTQINFIELSDSDDEIKSSKSIPIKVLTQKELEESSYIETNSNTDASQNVESQLQQKQVQTKKRRKDKLQPMVEKYEVEFETINLTDEDKSKRIKKKKVVKPTTIEVIQNGTKTNADVQNYCNNKCEEFLNNSKTDELIKKIVEERVRINYLLASYGMPDIKFNLWSNPGLLQFQLNTRLKQRTLRRNGQTLGKKSTGAATENNN